MSRGRRDPIEPGIELALNPGRFIAYGNCWDFVPNRSRRSSINTSFFSAIHLLSSSVPTTYADLTPPLQVRRAFGASGRHRHLGLLDASALGPSASGWVVLDTPPREPMKYGAQNALKCKVKSIRKGDVMSLVKFDEITCAETASVVTTESVEALRLKEGEEVLLVIKAIHVLPVKE